MPEPTSTDPSRGRHHLRRFVRRALWVMGLVIGAAVARDLTIRHNDRRVPSAGHDHTNLQR